ncbi:hypothetical protein HanXRQr2_Chr08g0350301 [Helianthus annuus]|uniref:Uncharacterized protein n=1 Tax=Helianthus annuus TaxID=4232 RepID=A0A9K3NDP8_HELAN|nr:hypothetical protein HanXRQr2_Chr08g0350301 [Helianthus annuus]
MSSLVTNIIKTSTPYSLLGYWILIIPSFTNWPVIVPTSKIAYNSPNL